VPQLGHSFAPQMPWLAAPSLKIATVSPTDRHLKCRCGNPATYCSPLTW